MSETSQDYPLKTALFTYSDGKQRQISKIRDLAYLDKPLPGWQLAISDKETYFVAAANVKELAVRIESQQDKTP